MMKASNGGLASLLAATLFVACGGGTPEPVTPVEKAPEKVAEAPKPEASGEAAAGPDAEKAEQCIATANAKRAKFSGEPPKVTVKHILVRYKGTKNADASITRTREAACLRAMEARDKLREGADFDEMVKEYSEEPGAASRGGSVGEIERAQVVKPFADAAFELSVNQMSDVVETEFGFHLIVRSQ
ncbi:peptidylprolyl isomerase [Polyangium sp. 15x6]|uniref:peptidylprolyl isomerase n=1 Tax=Polyangium sp. 15x6 TaxID=3042687 RepID=UPI00249CDD6B|nr:peptidylprolyl isomerase [Polyangium sp. 15x6]MDI3289499.1 peptidylprolyl isomerase [Polyangium sp. 15x6]